MVCTFYLGLVRGSEHEEKLLNIAYWLDQNKFSTTACIVDGRMMLDVEPHGETPMTADEFKFYAAEIIIHALAKELGQP